MTMTALYATFRNRAAREDGAIALATLAFMMVAGLVSIMTLWTIGYATTAYNDLHAGTQAAAYAAVGRTEKAVPGTGASQLNFACSASGASRPNAETTCTNGETFNVVAQVFSRAFTGKYGLTYAPDNTGTVQLIDESRNPWPGLYAFYVPLPSGAARKLSAGQACPYREPNNGEAGGRLLCWSVQDGGAGDGPQYNSGVIVRTRATIRMPGCGMLPRLPSQQRSICAALNLSVTAAASVSQATQSTY